MKAAFVATVEDLERVVAELDLTMIESPAVVARAIAAKIEASPGAFGHPDSEARAYLAVERSAVIAAARRFLGAHDRVASSDKAMGVTRDDAYAMANRAAELRDVLQLHDENLARIVSVRREAAAGADL